MAAILMKCGHTAQGINERTQKPVCVICNCEEVAEEVPSLEGRKARCTYHGRKCMSQKPSAYNLPFFEHKPNSEYDEYYCGCWGWN